LAGGPGGERAEEGEGSQVGILGEEGFDIDALDGSSRDVLEKAIADYNATFGTSYDTSAAKFENYYKDLARRVKDREVDLVLVVNMFLTGFDATTLNTLWVDKNLKSHGLIQAFSRTNRILNSVKAYGNVVCFRNLESAVDDALALFGNRDARGVVLLKPYADYRTAYEKAVGELMESTPPGEEPFGEAAEKRFVVLFSEILKLRNLLTSFDEFAEDDVVSPRDLQDYTSIYNGLWVKHRKSEKKEKESILDDVVFEIELVKQVEVNIDYILMLVAKWREAKAAGTEHVAQVVDIENAIDASPTLRNKRDLIMDFVESQSVSADVGDDWRAFIAQRRDDELGDLIASESLKPDETRAFVADAFRDGAVPTTGTSITKILPPASRFSKDNNHAAQKGRVLAKLIEFFERYAGLT
jgi:type I restriction enzyme R subunit